MKTVDEIVAEIDRQVAEFRDAMKQAMNHDQRGQGTVNRCSNYIAALQSLRDFITSAEPKGKDENR